jgi:hypothetical protein
MLSVWAFSSNPSVRRLTDGPWECQHAEGQNSKNISDRPCPSPKVQNPIQFQIPLLASSPPPPLRSSPPPPVPPWPPQHAPSSPHARHGCCSRLGASRPPLPSVPRGNVPASGASAAWLGGRIPPIPRCVRARAVTVRRLKWRLCSLAATTSTGSSSWTSPGERAPPSSK